MAKLRLASSLLLSGVMVLPAASVVAQDEVAESATPAATVAADDPRLEELAALVPPALAGLPLEENLQLATGEEMAGVMQPEEVAILAELLEANDASVEDYAAAGTYLEVSDTQIVVIQAHRVRGVEAAETTEAWAEILSLNLEDPQVAEGFIAGRPVTLVSDGASGAMPLLHLFPADDVVWMMWSDDTAFVEEAMDEVGADEPEETEK